MENLDEKLEKLDKRLKSLELRISRIESDIFESLKKEPYRSDQENLQPADPMLISETPNYEDKGIETRIGRFGLAWLGNIVLLFGITFLTQYLMELGYKYFSVLLGYFTAVGILLFANYLKTANVHLAFMFRVNAQIVFYYITVRLHFFTESPVLNDKTTAIILLLLIVGVQVYMSVRIKSQSFAALALILALTTSIIGDTTHFTLPMLIITAAGAIFYYYRFKWEPLVIVIIILTYISLLIWLLGNPFMGHPVKLVAYQHYGFIYLLGLGASYSLMILFRSRDSSIDGFLTGVIILNGLLFTFMLGFVVLGFYSNNYVNLFSIIAVWCLIYSIILFYRSDWNFPSAFYALYGFLALSIALYGLFGLPEVYLVLSVQSLIVVSMGLWFRNKLIAVMNSILFLTILFIYLLTSKSVNGINFSFALIALVSARIINWKKSRLHIKTELIRNLYLFIGFFMMLFALHDALPRHLITLSWSLAALLYFIISFILKNVKYRYMALGTMICAAIYLLIIDMAKIELVYRVLALLFLAAVSIGISIYYTNRIKKSDN
jgi:hypothetical protein